MSGEKTIVPSKDKPLEIEILPETLVFERDGKKLSFSFAAPDTGIILRDKSNNKELSWIMAEYPYLSDSFIADIQNNLLEQENTCFHFHSKEGSHKVWFEKASNGNYILSIQPVKKPEDSLSIELTRDEMTEIVDHYHSYFHPETSS